jgi:putative salt-induced outer membrane protein YdiY
VAPAAADEVVFKNGDRLTGVITSGAGGKVTIKTDVAGDVTVDLGKVRTFSTDKPIRLGVGEKTVLDTKVAPGAEGTVEVAPEGTTGPPRTVSLADVTRINPPPVEWKASVSLNATLEGGNTKTASVGFNADAIRRTEVDRLTFGAAYRYSREEDPDTGEKSTSANNWFVLGKYDYFFTKRFYGYAGIRLEGDDVADLKFRAIPSVGVGYQWFEGPTFNLATEAGIAYVYEDYETTGSNDYVAGRLAYHVDWTPRTGIFLFHNFEYMPSFEDPTGQYLINADAGARFTLISNLFSEVRAEWKHNESPAPGRKKDDFRLMVGLGWTF